jgi:hypothetical protein
MKRATTFMVEKVATRAATCGRTLPGHDAAVGRNGSHADDDLDPAAGYAVDGASLSLMPITPPATDYYYRAAEQVASALMFAQHPSGGWN